MDITKDYTLSDILDNNEHIDSDTLNSIMVGIEDADDHSENEEHEPFDPEEISIDTKVFSLEAIIRRLLQHTIVLNPDFQRSEVWSNERKSQLIESILLKIPIPMFYVSADEYSNWAVVDGLQRMSTIRDFILGKDFLRNPEENKERRGHGMHLKGLEFLGDKLDGKQFFELPVILSNRILETQLTFTIINPGTHEEVKRNIFKRLNTGGMPLSSQEIRNALYTGPSTKLLNKLSADHSFFKATCNSIHPERMEDKELILRFVSFLIRPPHTYKKTISIDTWLSDTMIILNARNNFSKDRTFLKRIKNGNINPQDITPLSDEEILSSFRLAMDRSYDLFGIHAFRKSAGVGRRSPINKSLFETWGYLLCKLNTDQFNKLIINKKQMLAEYLSLVNKNEFIIAISRDSMKKSSVTYRFEELNKIISKYIG